MKPMLTRPYQQRTFILQPCNPNQTLLVELSSPEEKKTTVHAGAYVVGIWPLQPEKIK